MNKIFFFSFSLVILCFMACNNSKDGNSSSGNDQAQKNLEASHIISEAFKTGDVSKLDDVVSPDFIDHRDVGDIKGIDSLKKSVQWVKENMKNMKMSVTREWADDDYVAAWMNYSGNNSVAMPGMPAGPYEWNIIELTKYKDGKAIEHWAFTEAQTIAKMMQPADTTTAIQGD
jgi:predicted SnoaL-like aldol condensation-catalyzing enzyme